MTERIADLLRSTAVFALDLADRLDPPPEIVVIHFGSLDGAEMAANIMADMYEGPGHG